MTRRGKADAEADRLWRQLSALVMENQGDWRRRVSEHIGMPFSRWRALKRLADAPLTLRALAEAMTTDAPATTVAVNELEQRGLVTRNPHPDDARAKQVSITAAGRRVLATTQRLPNPAPAALACLPTADFEALARILETIRRHPDP